MLAATAVSEAAPASTPEHFPEDESLPSAVNADARYTPESAAEPTVEAAATLVPRPIPIFTEDEPESTAPQPTHTFAAQESGAQPTVEAAATLVPRPFPIYVEDDPESTPENTAPKPTAQAATAPTASQTPEPSPKPTEAATKQPVFRYAPLAAQNPDFVGWLTIPGTVIDYPVMKSSEDDPQYYIHRDFYGNRNTTTAPNTSRPMAKGAMVRMMPVGMTPLRVLVKATATFRLYAYTTGSAAAWVNNVNDITLDGIADAGSGTFGEKEPWRADFTGLPMYNDSREELHYIVKEIGCTPVGYEPTEIYVENGQTITNKPASAVFTVQKLWRGTAGNTWPDGEKITLTLKRKTRAGAADTSFAANYTLSADEIIAQDDIIDPYGVSRPTGTLNGTMLTVEDLPKYDANGNEWLYYVTESAILNSANEDVSGNYSVTYQDKNNYNTQTSFTYSGGKITNTRSTKQLSLTKAVAGNMGDKTQPFLFTISLQNTNNSAYSGDVACVFKDQDVATENRTLSLVGGSVSVSLKHNESVTLLDLPGGLQFSITESGYTGADYQTAYTINGADASTGRTVTGNLSVNPAVICTNTKQLAVPTGVATFDQVFLWPMPFLALCVLLLNRKKRKSP